MYFWFNYYSQHGGTDEKGRPAPLIKPSGGMAEYGDPDTPESIAARVRGMEAARPV